MSSSSTDRLRELDRRYLWHPFTQMQGWQEEEFPIIERGEGSRLYDTDGNSYIDGTSSLWCNVFGHNNPVINEAVSAQLGRISHSTMLGLSHPSAIELAQRLVEITPSGLDRVFFSDNGSTSCEIALKMAFQWCRQNGKPDKTAYICLKNSYHGDTIGSVSVGGIDLFHSTYRPLLFDCYQAEPGDLADMERLLQENHQSVTAVVMEPLVQGAAGMIVHPEGYLRGVRELCDRYDVFLICDEVATGFGRTGKLFACEHEQVIPDFLCLAKGLTGGYLPLAATLTTERVYNGFLGNFEEFKTFFHGHTFTGNPLACAAALATLDLFESELPADKLKTKAEFFQQLVQEKIAPLAAVREIRQRGMMCGIELIEFPLSVRIGHQVTLRARQRGAIVRPLGDVVVLMPILNTSDEELLRLVEITAEAITYATTSN